MDQNDCKLNQSLEYTFNRAINLFYILNAYLKTDKIHFKYISKPFTVLLKNGLTQGWTLVQAIIFIAQKLQMATNSVL